MTFTHTVLPKLLLLRLAMTSIFLKAVEISFVYYFTSANTSLNILFSLLALFQGPCFPSCFPVCHSWTSLSVSPTLNLECWSCLFPVFSLLWTISFYISILIASLCQGFKIIFVYKISLQILYPFGCLIGTSNSV